MYNRPKGHNNKKMKLKYHQAHYGQIFWVDGDDLKSHSVHENDGEYRNEYMSPIFEMLGVQVEYSSELPESLRTDYSDMFDPDYGEEYEDR